MDGASTYQIFTVNSGATPNAQFLTLAHGNVTSAGFGFDGLGGAIGNNGTLTVNNSTFSANQPTASVNGNGDGRNSRNN